VGSTHELQRTTSARCPAELPRRPLLARRDYDRPVEESAPFPPALADFDVVAEVLHVGSRRLSIVRPRSSEELLDEAAFEREEFLPYWAELWPSSLALADAVAGREVAGLRVLELGCGLAIPSVVAALGGARVLASDWSPDALLFAAENARRSGVEIATSLASWDDGEALAAHAPWDLVLASDVLYERRNGDQLAALLPRLVGPAGAVLLADPGRPHTRPFLAGLESRWRVEPLEGYERPFVVALRPA
jgi:predicted nicotinamide N-methyase